MYETELTELAAAGVRFLVIGGVAVGLHGHPQATFDLDILPDLSAENLDRLVDTLSRLGYKPRVPVDPAELKDPDKRKLWYEERNMKVFSFVKPDRPQDVVDVMIYHPVEFEECFDRKLTVSIGGQPIGVASVADLLELKKQSARPKDLDHIAVLERVLKRKDK